MRIPLKGGTARAYKLPDLDSVLWSVRGAPAIERVLGFDPDDGSIAVLDDKGQPRRLDLRATAVRTASRARLASLSSANGSDIFGVDERGEVIRLSPTGEWKFEPPSPARWVFPQPNGSLVIAGNQGGETHLWLIRPTDDDILASRELPQVTRGIRTQVGDRLYFTVDSGLIGISTRDLALVKSIRLGAPIRSVAPTPSGDRLYIALRGRNEIAVFDRYREGLRESVSLPGAPAEVRMDPLGQNLLVSAEGGDSAWVVAIATNRVSGSIRTAWRPDLPAFAPGKMIVTVHGDDVVFLRTSDLRPVQTARKGAVDYWYFFAWNGFRPRSPGLDQPVVFDSPTPPSPGDSLAPAADSATVPPIRDASPTMIDPPQRAQRSFMVSFAAVLSEQRAAEVAASIQVNGVRPRVAPTASGSSTIYRVVLGPYPTREEADRIGRDSRRQYWVYEETR